MPFREAHHVTGALVKAGRGAGRADLAESAAGRDAGARAAHHQSVFEVLTAEQSVASRTSFGGTAPENVAQGRRGRAPGAFLRGSARDEPARRTLRRLAAALALLLLLLALPLAAVRQEERARAAARRAQSPIRSNYPHDEPSADAGRAGFRLSRRARSHVEEVPLARIAEAVGTPVYCYSSRAHRAAATGALPPPSPTGRRSICYSVKANSNLAVIATLARLGAGADVVSEGEFRRALAAGMPGEPHRLLRRRQDRGGDRLRARGRRHQINVESEPELDAPERGGAAPWAASARSPSASIPMSMRAPTPRSPPARRRTSSASISPMRPARFRRAAQLPGIEPVGIALHIGSQLTDLGALRARLRRVVELMRALRAEGIALEPPRSRRRPRHPLSPRDAAGDRGLRARWSKRVTDGLGAELAFEPGRAIVGNAGVLVARVLYVKDGVTRRFLIHRRGDERPHPPRALRGLARDRAGARAGGRRPSAGRPTWWARSARPATAFAAQRPLPPLAAGELIALLSAGAYGAVDEFRATIPACWCPRCWCAGRFRRDPRPAEL